MRSSRENMMLSLLVVQAQKAAYNGHRYKQASSKVGDKIFLSKRLFTTAASKAQPLVKLGAQCYSPFRV